MKITKEDLFKSQPYNREGSTGLSQNEIYSVFAEQIYKHCPAGTTISEAFEVHEAYAAHTLDREEYDALPTDTVTKKKIIPMEYRLFKRVIGKFRIGDESSGLRYMQLYIHDFESSKTTLCKGTEVSVCENGNIFGWDDKKMKTPKQDFKDLTDSQELWMYKWDEKLTKDIKIMEDLKNVHLSDSEYKQLIGSMAIHAHTCKKGQLIYPELFSGIVRQSENKTNPFHTITDEENGTKSATAWSLYNCATEALKYEHDYNNRANKHINVAQYFQNLETVLANIDN